MKKYSVVGKSLKRVDGIAKATGRAKFTYDMELPNMLWGRILRSPHPHAKIINIDISEAEKLPGVKAVITGKDIGPVRYGFVDTPRYPADQLVLAIDKVRYIGEEVAAVAATSKDIADEALSLIKVEYEELPAVFDPEEAMRDGAPEIHDEIVPDRPCAWEDWGVARKARSYKAENNICAISQQGHGDVEKGFKESDYIREDRYSIPSTSHMAMEPHVALASYDPSFQKYDLWLTHMGYEIKRYWLARALNIPISRVRVHKAYVGGAFGGKIDPFSYEFLAAFLSKKTLRPVKISLTREEVFIACRLSHRFIINLKTGVKKDGTIMAQEVKAIDDPGAYRGSSPVVLFLTHGFRRPIYNIPNSKHDGTAVYTNKSICMPRRGHGSPQMSFAAESQLDQIAEDLGMDPAELRLKNVRKVGDVLPNGDTLHSCGLTEGIKKAMEASGWKEKRGKGRANNRGIGMGVTAMFNGAQYYPFGAAATIKLNPDGTFTLFCGAIEFGQGSDTAISQIAAEELGVGINDIILVSADSELCPIDHGNWLSGGIFVTGEAVRKAAVDVRTQILEFAAQWFAVKEDDLELGDRKVYDKVNPEKMMTYGELMINSIQARNGDPILGKGFCKPVPEVEFYPSLSKGTGRWTNAYTFSIIVAEVEVDKGTGKVRVIKLTSAEDCGFPINPLAVEGQVESQAVQGLGDALFEYIITENGRIVNPTLTDYKVPGILDIPEGIDVNHIITNDPKGPFGAKEVGESSRSATIAAIANAVYDATGVRIKDLPLIPEKLLQALMDKRG